ncbi:MAG: alpha/beta hydrolase [Pseudomonas sp.]|uniref:alpha/beta fold hydrolase n=1 Tax=Pseudomonas sp. TaxID=306 RepID=UPI002392BC10|nr:alpha/beta hydrolase [Pseudomonas sp.]MDE1194884.1 alpha/beta hydrolase [Pseudomonas sp.]
MTEHSVSFNAATHYLEVGGRTLAYRTFGHGTPLVMCVRFRGTMESWDPAFLDGLAQQGFQVTIFDYSGLGRSTGERTYNPASLAKDTIELITALKLGKVVLAGWSIGGVAAQIVLAQAPQLVSHLVLIATTPPGLLAKPGEQLFYELAKRDNNFEDFVSLFFEPDSPTSRAAAERSWGRLVSRRDDASPEVPFEWAGAQLGEGPKNPVFPADAVLHVLKNTEVPVLHLGADHDIAFPVENWYALSDQLPTLHVVTFPSSGHGPQLQYPRTAARHIAAFVEAAHD